MDKKFENIVVSEGASKGLANEVYLEQSKTDRQPEEMIEAEPEKKEKPYYRDCKMSIYNRAAELFRHSGSFVDALKKEIGYKAYGEMSDFQELQHAHVQESSQEEAHRVIDSARKFLKLLRDHNLLENSTGGISNYDLAKLPEFEAYIDKLESEI